VVFNENILNNFLPITLEEMDSVKLMTRTDIKYVFHINKLESVLNKLCDNYKILEINGKRYNNYETIYFDTHDFKMYHQHHNGKLNRNKVRFRKYLDSGVHFFEIKFKNNKGRTIKERIKRKNKDACITDKAEDFLKLKTNFNSNMLSSKITINYSRITLVNKEFRERLTIDTDIKFSNNEHEKYMPELVIAELKRDSNLKTKFIDVMKDFKIVKGSFSKYCFGIIYLNENIKKNNFIQKLLTIKKICNEL